MARLKSPVPFLPSEVISLSMRHGYTALVLVQYPGEKASIVAGYTSLAKAAKAHEWWLQHIAKILPSSRPFPIITSGYTFDLWCQLRQGNREEWLCWLSNAVFTTINTMGVERPFSDILSGKLAREHRTIQQAFLRTIQMTITRYLACEPGTDLRNEAAVEWAKAVAAIPVAMPHI